MPEITKAERAADRELIGKATPGDWYAEEPSGGFSVIRVKDKGQLIFHVANPDTKLHGDKETSAEEKQANLDICVAARNQWPLYVERVEELEAEIERLKADLKVSETCTRIAREVGAENCQRADAESKRWADFNHEGQPFYGIARLALDEGDSEKAKDFFDRFSTVWDNVWRKR